MIFFSSSVISVHICSFILKLHWASCHDSQACPSRCCSWDISGLPWYTLTRVLELFPKADYHYGLLGCILQLSSSKQCQPNCLGGNHYLIVVLLISIFSCRKVSYLSLLNNKLSSLITLVIKKFMAHFCQLTGINGERGISRGQFVPASLPWHREIKFIMQVRYLSTNNYNKAR